MWIVRLALRRPYTFVVMAILILAMGVIGPANADRHFPEYRYPGRGIIWNYNGLVPKAMSDRI